MKDLTERAKKNLAAGATAGPGTPVCVVCGGEKEDSRLNSSSCRRCSPPLSSVRSSRRMAVEVSADVFAALAAEAQKNSQTPEERVAFLLTKKYTR